MGPMPSRLQRTLRLLRMFQELDGLNQAHLKRFLRTSDFHLGPTSLKATTLGLIRSSSSEQNRSWCLAEKQSSKKNNAPTTAFGFSFFNHLVVQPGSHRESLLSPRMDTAVQRVPAVKDEASLLVRCSITSTTDFYLHPRTPKNPTSTLSAPVVGSPVSFIPNLHQSALGTSRKIILLEKRPTTLHGDSIEGFIKVCQVLIDKSEGSILYFLVKSSSCCRHSFTTEAL